MTNATLRLFWGHRQPNSAGVIVLSLWLMGAANAHAQSYYDDGPVAKPLSQGSSIQYRVDGLSTAEPNRTAPAPVTPAAAGVATNTVAGVRNAITDLEAGLGELKGYSVDMSMHIQQNGLQGFIDMPRPLTDRGTAIGQHLGRSIQSIGAGVRDDMLPAR